MKTGRSILLGIVVSMIVSVFSVGAYAQPTTITHHGRLSGVYSILSGPAQLRFRLYGSPTGGEQIGPTVTVNNVDVLAGTFSAQLNFGATAFPGANRFVEIDVRRLIGSGYDTLTPRQPISSTPYAVRALSAASADSISGNCASCVTDANIASVSGSKVTGPVAAATFATNAGTANNAANATNAQNAVNATNAQNAGHAVNATNAQNAISSADSQKLGGISANQYLLINGDGSQLTNVNAAVADGSVTSAKLSDNAVTTSKIADGSITAVKFAPGGVLNPNTLNTAVLAVSGDSEFGGNVRFGGSGTFDRHLSIATALSVGTNFEVNGASSFAGNASFDRDVTFGRDVRVTRNARFNDSLNVDGNSRFDGPVSAGSTLSVTGTSSFGGDASFGGSGTFAVDGTFGGSVTIGSILRVGSVLDVDGNASFGKDVAVARDFIVTRDGYFGDSVLVDGSMAIGSSLDVDGNSILRGTLRLTAKSSNPNTCSSSTAGSMYYRSAQGVDNGDLILCRGTAGGSFEWVRVMNGAVQPSASDAQKDAAEIEPESPIEVLAKLVKKQQAQIDALKKQICKIDGKSDVCSEVEN